MKKMCFGIGVLLASVLTMQASIVTYTPDNTTVFPNPERGFTEEYSNKVSTSKPHVVKDEIDEELVERDKMRLLMVLYNFYNFKSKDLPDKVLAGFDEDMQERLTQGIADREYRFSWDRMNEALL